MFANLKNTGTAMRIVYDTRGRERQIPPGIDVAVELPERAVQKMIEAAKKGDTLKVRTLDNDDPDVDTRAEMFTLGESEGIEGQAKAAEPQSKLQTPRTLNEINNGPGMQKRYHGDPGTTDKGTAHDRPPEEPPAPPPPRDPIQHQAEQAAQAATQEPVVEAKRDPSTPMELIQRESEYSLEQLREHAVRLLPKDTLKMRPTKAQIMSALQKAGNRVNLQG